MTVEISLSLRETADRLAAGAVTSVDLTETLLARIDRLNPLLHAFIRVTPNRARADAAAADARRAAGRSVGPLDGVPIGLKDIFETEGITTTAHSRIRLNHVPAADSTAAARLRTAGTVLLGKLATHEFAFGGPSFDLAWPPVRNPWDTERFTSGSSSGSAAAIVAGLCHGTLGSDTGGSIRGPCALTGLAGIKPTYGLVSRAGVFPLSWTLDHVGPMAATIEDCALLLQAIAGPDPRDPTAVDRPLPDFAAGLRSDLKGLRVGVMRRFHETDAPVSAPMAEAFETALGVMRDLGANIRDVDCAPLLDYHAPTMLILLAEAWAYHRDNLRTRWHEYGRFMRERVATGAFIGVADYIRAIQMRRDLTDRTLDLFADVDVLATPVAAGEAPLFADVRQFQSMETPSFTTPFNLTGLPTAALVCGFGPNGLPLGVQIAAAPFADSTALAVAHAYERAAGWWQRRPTL